MALERLKPAPSHDLQFLYNWDYTPIRVVIIYEVYSMQSSPLPREKLPGNSQALTLSSGPHASQCLRFSDVVPGLRDDMSGQAPRNFWEAHLYQQVVIDGRQEFTIILFVSA